MTLEDKQKFSDHTKRLWADGTLVKARSAAAETYKQHSPDTIQRISIKKILATSSIEERIFQRQSELRLLTPLEEYHSRQAQYLIFECIKCGEQQPKALQAFERGSRCYRCHPAGKSNLGSSEFVVADHKS